MAHYRLDSPAAPNTKLTPRGSRSNPVYQCTATNTYWFLHMDDEGNRFLSPYLLGGEQPVIDKRVQHPVPDNWTGDPETIELPFDKFQDLDAGERQAFLLEQGLYELLENGDHVVVTDGQNIRIGDIVIQGNVLIAVARPGFQL